MSEFSFDQLITIYEASEPPSSDGISTLKIVDQDLLNLALQIDENPENSDTTGISFLKDLDDVEIGNKVPIRIALPKTSLGLLAFNVTDFLEAPTVQQQEPANYFIFENQIKKSNAHLNPTIATYRIAMRFIGLLRDCATIADDTRRELVFVGSIKRFISTQFKADDIRNLDATSTQNLLHSFEEQHHRDSKLTILQEEVLNLLGSSGKATSISIILRNMDVLLEKVQKGYKLYVSEFSYSRIRKELETAKLEFVSKIHATIVGIQGQVLGIPISTIVVASQLKRATDCGSQFWMNVSVVFGAWVFLWLLRIAVNNQFATLNDLVDDITVQRKRLQDDYALVSDQFDDIYEKLLSRAKKHKFALRSIIFLGLTGAVASTVGAVVLSERSLAACFVEVSLLAIDSSKDWLLVFSPNSLQPQDIQIGP